MSGISTHVLDVAKGRPGAKVKVWLEHNSADGWAELAEGLTDEDGRLKVLDSDGGIAPGEYRLHFDVAGYFAAQGVEGFYVEAVVHFVVRDPAAKHHVPLLLSPFGYSTYRGS